MYELKDLSGDKTLKYKLSNLPEHVVLQPMPFDLSKHKDLSKLKEILNEYPKQALSLQLRNVTVDSLREIIPLCSNIKSLDLINSTVAEAFSRLPKLTKLVLKKTNTITPEMKFLKAKYPFVTYLKFDGTEHP